MKTAIAMLIDKLPHGSGINGDWSVITTDKNLDVVVSNTYSAMLEGMYCHDWNFSVTYKRIPSGFEFVSLNIDENTKSCECGCGLQEYLEGAMPY